jgi:uncharacterized protein (UPF0333 family)
MIKKIRVEKRGQIAFEFLSVYLVILVFFLGAMYVVMREATYSQMYAETEFAREVTLRIATEINIASRFVGYEKNLSIPTSIRGEAYSLSIVGGTSLLLNYTSVVPINFYYPLEANVTNQWGAYGFEINTSKGYIYIKNEGGSVRIYE